MERNIEKALANVKVIQEACAELFVLLPQNVPADAPALEMVQQIINDSYRLRTRITEILPKSEPKSASGTAYTGHVSGRALCRHLVSLGVPAQKVVRHQETGDYIADFFVPDMAEAVAPAKEWAKRIQEVLPLAKIIATHDTIADWRPGRPVIYASVIFSLEEAQDV